MQNKLLKIEKKNNWVNLLLNNQSKKNALDDDLIVELVQTLKLIDQDNSVRGVLLGSTSGVFCAGGDIKAMLNKTEMFQGGSIDLRRQYHQGIQEIARAMEAFRKPIMAVVNGPAVGAGADLAFMCDLRIASVEASFAETFSNLALVPGDGGTFFLTRAIGYAKAMELYLTARTINADEAEKLELINWKTTVEGLWPTAEKIMDQITTKPPVAIEMTKQALKEAYGNRNLESNLNLLSSFQAITQMSNDHQRGLRKLKNGDEIFEGN